MKHNLSIGIAILFFLTSSLLFWHIIPAHEVHLDLDSPTYERIAHAMLTEKSTRDSHNNDIPVQTIGYPFFLALVYSLCGEHQSLFFIIQILLAALAIMLVCSAAYALYGDKAAFIATTLACTTLGFTVFNSYLLYCSFVTGHDECARYRMPLEPVLIILATDGILLIYEWFKRKQSISTIFNSAALPTRIHTNAHS